VKGAIDIAVGKTKEVMGQMLGDKEFEAEGKIGQVKGAAHIAVGNIKDAARVSMVRLHRSMNRY
jgi:uncharacterized protein YjbJ (UPF0337 family)